MKTIPDIKDIETFNRETTVIKEEGRHDRTHFYPIRVDVIYNIVKKDSKKLKYKIKLDLQVNEDETYSIKESSSKYELYKLLDEMFVLWAKTKLHVDVETVESIAKNAKPVKDTLFEFKKGDGLKSVFAFVFIAFGVALYQYTHTTYYTFCQFLRGDFLFQFFLVSLVATYILHLFARAIDFMRIMFYGALYGVLFVIFSLPFSSFLEPNVVVSVKNEEYEQKHFIINGKKYEIGSYDIISICSYEPLKVNRKVYKEGRHLVVIKDKK